MSPRALGPLLVALLAARPLAAQLHDRLGVDVGLARPRFTATSPTGTEQLSGLFAHARVRVRLQPVSVDVSYAQGRVSADAGSAAARTFVDGSVFAVYRPPTVSWLTLRAGPHLRAYSAPGGTERWVLWELHAHGEMPIVADELTTYAEGWIAPAASVNLDAGAAGAKGAEVGVMLHLPRSPLWARLSFVADQAKLKGGARTEALQTVVASVGFGGR